MDHTPRLSLPFIMPSQAQKHVTHNEAIQALDALVQPVVESRAITTPPTLPLEGEAWLVPSGATGAWAGHADEIASYQSGAWQFHDPAPGWQVFCRADRTLHVFDGSAWRPLASLGSGLDQLGIHASADTTNRLTVASAASLFTHDGHGHQLKINKASAGETASLLFQSNWSGRAEMGLAGDDHWRLKVSPDGSTWLAALSVDPATGATTVAGLRPSTDNTVPLGGPGARWSAIWSATGTISTSDAREKCDIAPTDLGLDFILALEPVRFRWREGSAETQYGLVAQQVQRALAGHPFGGHVLADPEDSNSGQGLRYESFIAPMIAAIQELATRVRTLESGTLKP